MVRYGVDAHCDYWCVYADLLDWPELNFCLRRDAGMATGGRLSATLPWCVGASALYADAVLYHWFCPVSVPGAHDALDDARCAVSGLHSHGALQGCGGVLGALSACPA